LVLSNKLLPLSVLFFSLLSLSIPSGQASAIEWTTNCGRSSKESRQCQSIKGDAILAGSQGTLHTIVFPDGARYQFFYTGGAVCNLQGLMVRQEPEPWFSASQECSKNNRLIFNLPVNGAFFWVSISDD
jgi:hypothetical protein